MPGFILQIGGGNYQFPAEPNNKLIVERIVGVGYAIERRVVNKFMKDRVFKDSKEMFILIEGVILNRFQLISKYGSTDWADCIRTMYEKNGDVFFNEFRGSFSGVLFDKTKNEWLIYTNHVGDKQVFFSKTNEGFLFGSEIRYIVECRKQYGLPVTIDETGCYFALTHGFCIEDKTLVKEIHKLSAGHYYHLSPKEQKIYRYHRFVNVADEQMSVEEAVNGIDRLFRNAIRLQFDKDREYNYRHIACLSGGLDSRMTVWVAHEMGYSDQLNITFSQSGYLDFTIAQQIAIDLHHDWLFKPLDGGDFVKMIDEITPITYGSANFFGLAHGKSMENLINYEPFGIIHTGQIGDSIIGTFFKKNEFNSVFGIGQSAYSVELIERIKDYVFNEDYGNEEIFCLYTRAFTGANQGLLTFQENSESCSPFLDVDFLEFCYSIPLNLRFNHKIYFDWILQKYPGAAIYPWENTGRVIKPFQNKENRYVNIKGKRIPAISNSEFPKWLYGAILRRLGLRKKGQKPKTIVLKSRNDMNPVDYWYETNPAFRDFLLHYWGENKMSLPNGQLGDDMIHLFEDCVVYDKLQCLSVLSAIKLILS